MCAGVVATALAYALYARFTWPWLVLGWVGLVPWLAVLDRTDSLAGTLGSALMLCVAFVLAVFGWFARSIQTYTGTSWVLALLLLALTAPLLQPQLVTFALARWVARRNGAGVFGIALAGAGIYVGTEWAIPKLFGDTLGYGLYPSVWMRQAADVAGVAGLTFALVVGNECALAMLRSPGLRLRRALAPAACLGALVLGLLAYGALRTHALATGGGPARPVTAGVVQAGLSKYDRMAAEIGTFAAVRTILDAHYALSTEILARADIDFLVWPETVYPTTFGSPKSADGATFDREIAAFVARTGRPLVFGSYDAEDGKEFNAAVFLEPSTDGRLTFDTYRKAALFPFIERVPGVLASPRVRRLFPWLGTWSPGRGAQVVPLDLRDGRTLRVAPLICYDVLTPGLALAAVRAGAELLVTLSNDSWFAAGPGPRLHLVGAVFRSIETHRPQVRATNTGISAVITPTGELLATAGIDERATLVATVVPAGGAMTLVVAWGDWFAPSVLAGSVALLAASWAAHHRRATCALLMRALCAARPFIC